MIHPLIKHSLSMFLLATTLYSGAAWSNALPNAGCSLASLAGSYSWNETTRTVFETENGPFTVHAVSVGREVNDGAGNITSGQMTINSTYALANGTFTYTGVVTVEPNCFGTYSITLSDGSDGGGGSIYIDPITHNFTLLDVHNIGTAAFIKDGSGGGLSSPFPNISWP